MGKLVAWRDCWLRQRKKVINIQYINYIGWGHIGFGGRCWILNFLSYEAYFLDQKCINRHKHTFIQLFVSQKVSQSNSQAFECMLPTRFYCQYKFTTQNSTWQDKWKKVTHYWKRPIYSWFTYWWWFSICSVSLPESILPNIPVPLAQAKSFWYQQTWIWASSATLVWICPASMLDRGSSWIPAQPLAKALGWRNMYENVRYITTYRYIMCLYIYIYIWNTYGYTGM